MNIRTIRIRPRRIAAPARAFTDDELAERQAARLPAHIDDLCRDWGHWVTTRKLAAPRPLGSVLGRLRTASSTAPGEGPRVRLSAECRAFNDALLAQSERDQSVLWVQYALPARGERIPVRKAADLLHMDRSTFYRVEKRVAISVYEAVPRYIATGRALGVADTPGD
jgi:hypothetical protein